MTLNVGTTDRIIRGIVAVLALALGIFVVQGIPGIILIVVGLIAGVTAAVSFCPLWVVLGVNTRGEESA